MAKEISQGQWLFPFFLIYLINAQFLYSITIYTLHYNPQHISSSTVLFRRTNCIITASGIITVCKRPYSTAVESGLSNNTVIQLHATFRRHVLELGPERCSLTDAKDCSPLSTGVLYTRLHWLTIPDAVVIQFVLLKMSIVLLETCRGL